MRKFLISGISVILLVLLAGIATEAHAGGPAPTGVTHKRVNNNCDRNHPNIVALYFSGPHSNPFEKDTVHWGCDVVWQPNKHIPNFIQIFYGRVTSGFEKGTLEWEKTWWNVAKQPGVCPGGWNLVPNAGPGWGDYLKPGVDYCVKDIEHHFVHKKTKHTSVSQSVSSPAAGQTRIEDQLPEIANKGASSLSDSTRIQRIIGGIGDTVN